MTKLNNSNCYKTQIVTKLKLWQLKLWQKLSCDKTQIVTKNQIVKKKKNKNKSIWQNWTCDKTGELKLWQNLKYDKSQITKIGSFSKNILTPWQLMRCSLGSVLRFSQSFTINYDKLFQNDEKFNLKHTSGEKKSPQLGLLYKPIRAISMIWRPAWPQFRVMQNL